MQHHPAGTSESSETEGDVLRARTPDYVRLPPPGKAGTNSGTPHTPLTFDGGSRSRNVFRSPW